MKRHGRWTHPEPWSHVSGTVSAQWTSCNPPTLPISKALHADTPQYNQHVFGSSRLLSLCHSRRTPFLCVDSARPLYAERYSKRSGPAPAILSRCHVFIASCYQTRQHAEWAMTVRLSTPTRSPWSVGASLPPPATSPASSSAFHRRTRNAPFLGGKGTSLRTTLSVHTHVHCPSSGLATSYPPPIGSHLRRSLRT